MHFQVLASDYDGTLACDGHVDEATVAAIRRLKDSGRKFVLVTGRCLEPLIEIFPELELCDLVVAENGALLYNPHTREESKLAEPPPPTFLARLAERGVPQLEIGRVIVATWTPHEHVVLEAIHSLALELQIIFNKGSVMVLPSNVNKSTGLQAALHELSLDLAQAVGIGDAENDETMLRMCGVGVAVDNALEAVKQRADLVTKGARGAGVTEVIDQLLADDLAEFRDAVAKRSPQPVPTSTTQHDATRWEEKPTPRLNAEPEQ